MWKTLHLSSRFRTSGSIEDARFIMPLPLIVSAYQIERFSCFNTIQHINATNDTFATQMGSYAFPHGNYTGASFAAQLQTALITLGHGNSTTVTYNSLNATLSIAGNTVSVIFNGLCTIAETLSEYKSQIVTEFGPLNLGTEQNIYIESNLASGDTLQCGSQRSANQICQVVPLSEGFGSLLLFEQTDLANVHRYSQAMPLRGRELTIRLSDSKGNTIHLQNVHWEMSIKLNIM